MDFQLGIYPDIEACVIGIDFIPYNRIV